MIDSIHERLSFTFEDLPSTFVVIDTVLDERPKRRPVVNMIYKSDSFTICLELQMIAFAHKPVGSRLLSFGSDVNGRPAFSPSQELFSHS